jgi:hypothetical protein
VRLGRILPSIVLICLLLAGLTGCSNNDEGGEQLDNARASYQEIRARAADLEGFFADMEEALRLKQGEVLAETSLDLVEEERRVYDAFLRSTRDAVATCEELQALGGDYAAYAERLLALIDANQAEAMLVAEGMMQVEGFVQKLSRYEAAAFVSFMRELNDLGGRILASRDSIRDMETESEEYYQRNLAP